MKLLKDITMAKLPSKELLNGTKSPETTTGEFRVGLGHLQEYLSELLGNDSLDKWAARATLGAMEKYCSESTGTADKLKAVFSPVISQPIHGMTVVVRANLANLSPNPSFKADETSALSIVKGNNKSLEAGDIAGPGHWLELKYDEPLNKWVLQNPARGIDVLPAFEDGTTMLFLQPAAPTGWMKLTEHDNKALRIVSSAGGTSGGTVAFTDVFTFRTITGTVENTTLSIEQIPSHVHSREYGATYDSGSDFMPGYRNRVAPMVFDTNPAGGNQPHTHGFTGTNVNMDIQYVDAIIAMKVS